MLEKLFLLLEESYDAVFLDPFSPAIDSVLYTTDFFKIVADKMKKKAILATYTSSLTVKAGLIEAGLHIGPGPVIGRKKGGILASFSPLPRLSPEEELFLGISDIGLPFRDESLSKTHEEIVFQWKERRRKARHITRLSSSRRAPLALLNTSLNLPTSLKKINLIPGNVEANYIICPVKKECICGQCGKKKQTSRDIVIELKKRIYEILSYKN